MVLELWLPLVCNSFLALQAEDMPPPNDSQDKDSKQHRLSKRKLSFRVWNIYHDHWLNDILSFLFHCLIQFFQVSWLYFSEAHIWCHLPLGCLKSSLIGIIRRDELAFYTFKLLLNRRATFIILIPNFSLSTASSGNVKEIFQCEWYKKRCV